MEMGQRGGAGAGGGEIRKGDSEEEKRSVGVRRELGKGRL